MHRAGRASLILDRMSEHKLHAVYVKKKKQSLYIHSCIFYTKDQEKTSSQIKRFSEGMQRSVTVVTVTTVTWDCTTFRAEEPEKKKKWVPQRGRVGESQSVGGESQRESTFPFPSFFLYKGRLGTSKKQGNHDNQTTNPGNQFSVRTVRGRLLAWQGLMWAERKRVCCCVFSPIYCMLDIGRGKKKQKKHSSKISIFQNSMHILYFIEATVV